MVGLILICMPNLPEIVDDVLVPVDVSEAFVPLDRVGIRFQLGHGTVLEPASQDVKNQHRRSSCITYAQ